MRGLVAALQFLTRLPLGRFTAGEADFVAAIRWFPAAGLVVGGAVAAAAWTGGLADPWIGALAGLGAWVAVTGALHLDGVSDLADALGAAHKGRERLLAVLADPHVGGFGVVAIGLQLIAKLVLIHALLVTGNSPAAALTLLLIPAAARIGPLAWTLWLPPLQAGLAARFRDAARAPDLAAWAVAVLAAAWFVPALGLAPVLVGGWGWWLRRTIGGISGDGHGAGIESVETGLLLVACILPHLP
jgi:adenosylcobinamide-GDP ribazoletransferase